MLAEEERRMGIEGKGKVATNENEKRETRNENRQTSERRLTRRNIGDNIKMKWKSYGGMRQYGQYGEPQKNRGI